ncbi:MAG: PDZ domain-containing protein [Schlesneria sp.]
MNMLSATIGDHTYVLSPLTGEWESADESPASATASTDVIPSAEIRRVQSSDTRDSEQKLRFNLDGSESHGLTEAIAKHESQAVTIAEKIRGLPNTSPKNEDLHRDLRQKLEASLSAAFELKFQLEKLRVKELQSRLSRLEQQIGRRQAQQKQIIERRTNELIAGEETEWNSDPNGRAQLENPLKAERASTESLERTVPSVTIDRQSEPLHDPKSTQVRFLTFRGPERIVPKIVYLEETIGLPARLNFERGSKEVRQYSLQVTSGYFKSNSRPLLLDVYPANSSSEAYLSHNSVAFEITNADLDYVRSGNFLTKVVYLPHSKVQQLAIANIETITSSRLDPGVDPIVEAERRGTVLAVLRFPSDENLKTEPTRWRPPQASKPGSGQKSAFFYGVAQDGKNPHPTAVSMDENGVIVKSELDQNSESLVPVPVSFPSGDELATNLVSAREETAGAQSEFLRQESLLKNNVTTVQEMASARRRLEAATRKEKILKETYHAAIQDLQFQIEAAQADYELAETLSKQIGNSVDMGASSQKTKLEAANKSVQAHLTLKRLLARSEHYKKLSEGVADVKGEPVSFTSASVFQPLKQMGVKLRALFADEMKELAKTTTKYRGGLKVLEVEPKSLAADNGIQAGDILVGLDKWETSTLDNVSWITKQVAERPIDPLVRNQLVKFFIYRGTEMHFGFLPFVPAKETAPQETDLDVLPKVEISR